MDFRKSVNFSPHVILLHQPSLLELSPVGTADPYFDESLANLITSGDTIAPREALLTKCLTAMKLNVVNK